MTNSMFGTPRRGHLMGTHTTRRSKITQDSAKEDYLFCSGCEDRLSRIERYVANEFFNKYKDPAFQQDFPITYRGLLIPVEMDVMQALKVNQGIMRLFIYSLLWRASISSEAGFKTFKLEDRVEERLRVELDIFLTDNIRDTLENCISKPIQSAFAYNIITCLELADKC